MPPKAIHTREEYVRRFNQKIEIVLPWGCWQWTGALSNGKYGSMYYEERMQKAHRVAYKLFIGPLGDDLELDHFLFRQDKCIGTLCANPYHCEPVTGTENRRRTKGEMMNKTHCRQGHKIEGDNEYLEPSTGYRRCLICKREAVQRYENKHNRIMVNGVRITV